MFTLWLLLGLLTGLVVFCGAWRCCYWRRHGIRGPSAWPLVGNMWPFFCGRRHFGDVYQQIYDAHPELPYVGIYRLFNEPAVLLRSQQLLKEVLIRQFHHFQDNVLWIRPERDPIVCCNPFVAKGDRWRHMRSEIVPIFTPNKVKSSFPHIASICERLRSHVAANLTTNSFEAKDLFSRFTLDVVASAAYGLDAQSFTNGHSDFVRLVEHLFLPNPRSLLETTALLFSPLLGDLIKYRYVPLAVQQWLSSIISNVLDRRLTNCQHSTAAPSDFVQWLIEAKERLNEPVDRHTIVGHCSTFLLEGFETSSSLMAFALYEYAINPSVQRQVLEEIDRVMERHGGELSYEALQDMPYLEASLYETLRLHPPMMALLKHCTKPFELPPQAGPGSGSRPFAVPEGMVFIVPVKAIHYDADLYPEPEKFEPQRFVGDPETAKEQRPSCAFLGFGEGPRMCPGMRFGLAQSKAGLVTLLSQYSVQLAPRTAGSLQIATTTFLTAAKDGIWISFEPRK